MPFTEPTADGDNNDRGVRQSVDFNVQLGLTDDLKKQVSRLKGKNTKISK